MECKYKIHVVSESTCILYLHAINMIAYIHQINQSRIQTLLGKTWLSVSVCIYTTECLQTYLQSLSDTIM